LSEEYTEEKDKKIYRRELIRLELALESAEKLGRTGKPLIALMHYPPIVNGKDTAYSELLSAYGAKLCVYGHIHNSTGTWPTGLDMETGGVKYRLVSADYLNFTPLRVI